MKENIFPCQKSKPNLIGQYIQPHQTVYKDRESVG